MIISSSVVCGGRGLYDAHAGKVEKWQKEKYTCM